MTATSDPAQPPTFTGVVGTHYRLRGTPDSGDSTIGATIQVYDETLSGDDKWLSIGSIFRDDDGHYAVYSGDGFCERRGDDPTELVKAKVGRWVQRMRDLR